MDELKFVLKGFLIAIVLTLALQIRVGNESLEKKSDHLLRSSSVGFFLTEAASGGAALLEKGYEGVSRFVMDVVGRFQGPSPKAKRSSTKATARVQSPPETDSEIETD